MFVPYIGRIIILFLGSQKIQVNLKLKLVGLFYRMGEMVKYNISFRYLLYKYFMAVIQSIV